MKGLTVPNSDQPALSAMLDELAGMLTDMTPEIRKAAAYVLDNPNDVGISSVREIAQAALVKPNTVVRMAQTVGFKGYEDFREPFREQIRSGQGNFPDRARWLQTLSKGGKLSGLYGDMASSSIANIENTFATADAVRMKAAADAIVQADRVFVLGVGANYMLANSFAYLADMALKNMVAIPKTGSSPIDDLAHAAVGDLLIAMTFKPYRSEVIQAVEIAKSQEVDVIAISDSMASPIVALSDYNFIVHTDTPQFFPSTVAAAALLEALIAFVIAESSPEAIARIRQFHERRFELNIYDLKSAEAG